MQAKNGEWSDTGNPGFGTLFLRGAVVNVAKPALHLVEDGPVVVEQITPAPEPEAQPLTEPVMETADVRPEKARRAGRPFGSKNKR